MLVSFTLGSSAHSSSTYIGLQSPPVLISVAVVGLLKGSLIVVPPIGKLQQYGVPPPGGLCGPWHHRSRQIILVWMILTYGKNSSSMGFHKYRNLYLKAKSLFVPRYLYTQIPMYLHTYIPRYLPTYLPSYLPTNLPYFLPSACLHIGIQLHRYIGRKVCRQEGRWVCGQVGKLVGRQVGRQVGR